MALFGDDSIPWTIEAFGDGQVFAHCEKEKQSVLEESASQ
jgi:hypothetical protein